MTNAHTAHLTHAVEFKGTVERLMGQLTIKAAVMERNDLGAAIALSHIIDKQVARVKINIMTHCFDALDYFNGKEE